jgi:hypothetical protein
MKTAKRYVGIFDILGFRDMIESQPLRKVIRQTQGFLQTTTHVLSIPQATRRKSLLVRVYQDTVFVSTHRFTLNDFGALLEYSAALIGFAFLEGIFLRGAITVGEIHVDDQIVIGKGIVRAYQMEQSQDWIGCWVDDLCFRGFPKKQIDPYYENFLLIRYPIPKKSGPMKKEWALNWPILVSFLPDEVFRKARAALLHRANRGPISWDAKKKFEQTDRFLSAPSVRRVHDSFASKIASKWEPESPRER